MTTLLFSDKRTDYINIILTLSPQTQRYLQGIMEDIMEVFPQDDDSLSAVSELHSMLEESSFQSVNNNDYSDLRQYFEGTKSV